MPNWPALWCIVDLLITDIRFFELLHWRVGFREFIVFSIDLITVLTIRRALCCWNFMNFYHWLSLFRGRFCWFLEKRSMPIIFRWVIDRNWLIWWTVSSRRLLLLSCINIRLLICFGWRWLLVGVVWLLLIWYKLFSKTSKIVSLSIMLTIRILITIWWGWVSILAIITHKIFLYLP